MSSKAVNLSIALKLILINPLHMCEGYGSRSVCVCSVTTPAATYIPGVYDANKVILGILLCYNHNNCMHISIETLGAPCTRFG